MNLYATLDNIKDRLSITSTDDDALLMAYAEAASREVDNLTHRHFYVFTGTRYFDTGSSAIEQLIDDVLSISAFTTDSENDGTYDGETWTEGPTNDFNLWPFNTWPKMEIQVAVAGTYSLQRYVKRYLQIVGNWGFGDGESATPYEAAGVTVTIGDGTTTTVAVSVEGTIQAGHTILAGTEQMYVSAATTDGTKEITAKRGVNGTTGAAQAAAAASIYLYPDLITQAVEIATGDAYSTMGSEGFTSEKIGDYSYQRLTNRGDSMIKSVLDRFVGSYIKPVVA